MAIVAIGSLLLTGCSLGSGNESDADGSDNPSFSERAATAIEGASAGGASDDQLAILREAQATGTVTLDQARQAVLATLDCIVDGGGSASYSEQREPSGLIVPTGMALAKDEESLTRLEPVIEGCMNRESFWVNNLYQMQPVSQELRDAYDASQAPAIRQCLEDHGYATDPKATPGELISQAVNVSIETGNAVDCYH